MLNEQLLDESQQSARRSPEEEEAGAGGVDDDGGDDGESDLEALTATDVRVRQIHQAVVGRLPAIEGFTPSFQPGTIVSTAVPDVPERLMERESCLDLVLRQLIPHTGGDEKGGADQLAEEKTTETCATRVAAVRINSPAGGRGRAAVQGMGGVGKTVLACQVAHHKDVNAHFTGGIFWAQCSSVMLVEETMFHLLDSLGCKKTEGMRFREVTGRQIKGWLRQFFASSTQPMLIVVDDAWRLDQIEPFQSCVGPLCTLLITTRSNALLASTPTVHVGLLTEAQCLQFVRERMPEGAFDEGDADMQAAIRHAGGLPAALAVMCGMVQPHGDLGWEDMSGQLQHLIDEHGAANENEYHWDDIFGLSLTELERSAERSNHDRDLLSCYRHLVLTDEDMILADFILAPLWKCPKEIALRKARKLVDRALLVDIGDGRFKVHDLHLEYLEGHTEWWRWTYYVLSYNLRCDANDQGILSALVTAMVFLFLGFLLLIWNVALQKSLVMWAYSAFAVSGIGVVGIAIGALCDGLSRSPGFAWLAHGTTLGLGILNAVSWLGAIPVFGLLYPFLAYVLRSLPPLSRAKPMGDAFIMSLLTLSPLVALVLWPAIVFGTYAAVQVATGQAGFAMLAWLIWSVFLLSLVGVVTAIWYYECVPLEGNGLLEVAIVQRIAHFPFWTRVAATIALVFALPWSGLLMVGLVLVGWLEMEEDQGRLGEESSKDCCWTCCAPCLRCCGTCLDLVWRRFKGLDCECCFNIAMTIFALLAIALVLQVLCLGVFMYLLIVLVF